MSAIGAERSRGPEGGIILIFGDRAGHSSACRLSDDVASDLHGLLGSMRGLAVANPTDARQIWPSGRAAIPERQPRSRLSPRVCIVTIAAASLAAWGGIVYAASLLL